MVRMSKMVEYAILILTRLSKLEDKKRMSAREISEIHNLPFPTVSKIMKQLAKENVVTSTQGSKGGYAVTKNTDDITLKMLIECLDGSSNIVTCMSDRGDCSYITNCSARGSMEFIDSEVGKIFDRITLKELLIKSDNNID